MLTLVSGCRKRESQMAKKKAAAKKKATARKKTATKKRSAKRPDTSSTGVKK